MSTEKPIPFIHNYCDRWCQRCPFTSRCSIYDHTAANESSQNLDTEALFVNLGQNLTDAIQSIQELVEAQGLDWDTFHKDAMLTKIKEPQFSATELALKNTAIKYGIVVRDWFEANKTWLQQEEMDMQSRHQQGIDQRSYSMQLNEAFEIVRWYNFFIGSKMSRALRGLHSDFITDEDPVQNDANGTAKATMIAINRSLLAWEVIRTCFPEKTDDLLDILRMLAWMRRHLRLVFPRSNEFIRPGFDQPEMTLA